ncbi:hypothetical protein SAMN02799626_00027 [Caulobacter sp. UNC279MFTsu5.1]|nr:hypothetical protein SAMN02799626_00027 [Caulobacter sp. UNC279MFTsu5.1]
MRVPLNHQWIPPLGTEGSLCFYLALARVLQNPPSSIHFPRYRRPSSDSLASPQRQPRGNKQSRTTPACDGMPAHILAWLLEQRPKALNVGVGFGGQGRVAREIALIPRRTGVVGGREAWRAKPIVHLSKVRSAGHDVGPWFKRIIAQVQLGAQGAPSSRHQLQEAHRALGRYGPHAPTAFDHHHRDDPMSRKAKPQGGLIDRVGHQRRVVPPLPPILR